MNQFNSQKNEKIRIGVDIGGTFTDFVIFDQETGKLETFKLPSTPSDPSQAVLEGLNSWKDHSSIEIIHGSTVATNTLLERKGANTALVTTQGFRDVLQIGRQNRPELYNLFFKLPQVLIPEEHRFEVEERVDSDGKVIKSLDIDQVIELISHIKSTEVNSIAISLLFSFLYPDHEIFLAKKFREAGFFVSVSCEILPEYREYERTSTTAVNAYVSPILNTYLSNLETALMNARIQVMQSNGGMISVSEARKNGVQCILSGPAGGVVGALFVSKIHQIENSSLNGNINDKTKFVSFDMGGTSTDVSLIDEEFQLTTESVISGCPIAIPMLDINTIGAGGGSIAHIDIGGALRVGPQSAGANPGPACYGNGALPTVTDANLVLGRIAPELFLGGKIILDTNASLRAIQEISQKLHMSPTDTALGIIEVVNSHMERALRVISVEKGYDPKDFLLLSFGGAGGLHATNLARRLGIPQVLIPPHASTLSALGMLAADVIKDYTQTVMLSGEASIQEIKNSMDKLISTGQNDLQKEGIHHKDIIISQLMDMRYVGQSYELKVPFTSSYKEDFHTLHQNTYGFCLREAKVEIVNIRVRAIGLVSEPKILPIELSDSSPSKFKIGTRNAIFQDASQEITFYRGEFLRPDYEIEGPAIIVRSDTTILLNTDDIGRVDNYGNLLISLN
jgi:N-methylhydantoinase A